MRYFLGVGRCTPNAAVAGDLGWEPIYSLQLKTLSTYWIRLKHMPHDIINKRIFNYCFNRCGVRCRTWCYRVKCVLDKLGCPGFFTNNMPISKAKICLNKLLSTRIGLEQYVNGWSDVINAQSAIRGLGKNKLRTYRLFKNTFQTECYCNMLIARRHRTALAKFRCGIASDSN